MAQKRIEVSYWKLTDLIPDDRNPRRNDLAVKPVAESIKQFGMRVPLVIDKKGTIICGHTRFKACVMLGMQEVPCVTADQLTLKQQRAFQLADNKTGELATWDNALLDMELSSLASIFDVASLGFVKKPKNEKTADRHESVGADEDGLITCPRCGRRFSPDEAVKHGLDPFDEEAEDGDLF